MSPTTPSAMLPIFVLLYINYEVCSSYDTYNSGNNVRDRNYNTQQQSHQQRTTIMKCYSCESDSIDSDCFKGTESTQAIGVTIKDCSNPDAMCYTWKKSNGEHIDTIRGCAGRNNMCQDGPELTMCSYILCPDPLCNSSKLSQLSTTIFLLLLFFRIWTDF